jgi:Zn-dependent peptidase ImmA (M78 family)/DNA-binding XRE family transcriptional regulator
MLTTAPGERVRTLRELLGLTQVRLAKVVGVAQSWLSEVETGNREPDSEHINLIAAATGTPTSFFYVQPTTVPLDSLRFRKLASASKITRRRIHAFYGESYRVTEDLIKHSGYPPATLPYASERQLRATDIEYFADLTRRNLSLAPDKPIPHLTRALERAGIATAPIVLTDFDTGEIGSSGHHFGVSYWGGIGEPALIGYFPGSQGDRDRFTLAHELGHLVLHTFRPSSPDPEREANQFASALLLPRNRILTDLSERTALTGYARLKATWGVSIQTLIMRGSDVGVIGETRKRSLFVQLSQYGWRKNEPVTVGQENPLLLWSLLARRFGVRPYLAAAEDLAILPVVLRSIAPNPDREPQSSAQHVIRLGRSPAERGLGDAADELSRLLP